MPAPESRILPLPFSVSALPMGEGSADLNLVETRQKLGSKAVILDKKGRLSGLHVGRLPPCVSNDPPKTL